MSQFNRRNNQFSPLDDDLFSMNTRVPGCDTLEEAAREREALYRKIMGAPEIPSPCNEITGIDRRNRRTRRKKSDDDLPVLYLHGIFYNIHGEVIQPKTCLLI